MRNEEGFVYPITLILTVLLCASVAYQLDSYLSEKRIITEQEHLLLLESLLQAAVSDLIELSKKNDIPETHIFSYEHGTVTLMVQNQMERVYVTLEAQLASGHKRFAKLYLDVGTHDLEEYWEVS
ncbi:competence type IV pilus minor pilin ComGG [Halalkalibacter urbisdiaboli]|uniref:competence type IV pilus minor pilin ComGG n=1 Tax=Halalkalibacter urbisdiaboli TaxID=1960589 RepID=UPI0013FE1301|nr:competence type IV pilus minor pilin ComGG [Halalkalibacter urbisdiaboli]